MTASTDLAGNPLLASTGLPRFDLIKPEHVIPAVRHCLANAEQQLTELEANIAPSWAGCFEKLEAIDRPFEYAWEPVTHLFGVMNSDALREAYETVLDEVVKFGLRASQSKPIYEACLGIRDGAEWRKLNAAQQRIVTKRIQSAELSGIGLAGPQLERFNAIVQELSQIKTKFSNNVLDATKAFELIVENKADVAGLPGSSLSMAAQSYNAAKPDSGVTATADAGPWRFTLDIPSFNPFMQHCRNRDLRETMYRAFITRASSGEFDNSDLINRILRLRHEKATLLGFSSYADLSLASKMAPSIAAVETMFETLRSASWDSAQREFAEIQQLAAASGQSEPLLHWDAAFWAERLREQRFDYTDEQLRPYFPLERVLDGMFALVEKVFGIRVRAKSGVPVWHDDVRYFEIFNESDQLIAGFYLDPFCRPETKRPGAWMSNCLNRRRLRSSNNAGAGIQIPVAHLVCNSTPPVDDKPSLMTFREVETLFHEFGHGLQHMLTTIDEADAAGINGVEWDAVELPSQFMENWCYHRSTLLGIAKHYKTGETLPDELFEKLTASRTFRAASMMLRQLTFGMTDMRLHGGYIPPEPGQSGETVLDIQRQVAQRTSILQPLPEDRMLCTFSHIFAGGYSAGYYSYKWAEVLSADAWGAFEEAGLDNEAAIAATGRRFRDTVLALGGSQHPMEVFRAFRGRDPNPLALLQQNGLA